MKFFKVLLDHPFSDKILFDSGVTLNAFHSRFLTHKDLIFFWPRGVKMSGILEILLIVAIILGILMLPRLTGKKSDQPFQRLAHGFRFTGWIRIAILASLFWLALTGFYLKPWDIHWVPFLYMGVGPVALIWGIYWVSSGFRKKKE